MYIVFERVTSFAHCKILMSLHSQAYRLLAQQKTAFACAPCRLLNMKITACLLVIFLLTNRAIFCKWSQKSQFNLPGRSISVEVRAHVIGMSENGAMAKEAAMQAGVHRATVFRIKTKFLQTGSVENRPKPGRPRSTTVVHDRFLRLTHCPETAV